MDNKLLALLIAASVALAGCNGESDDLPPGKLSMSNFKKNRSKWESLQVDDYQMHYRLACFCLDDATSQRLVKVTGNQLDSAVNADTNAALLGETYETLTIDELFGRIALEESRAINFTLSTMLPTVIRPKFRWTAMNKWQMTNIRLLSAM